jgi:hypothetical protein
MSFNLNTLAEARKQGATDDQIWDHLISQNPSIEAAKSQGANLTELAIHLEKKGGETKDEIQKQSQPKSQLDYDASRPAQEQEPPVGPEEGAKRGQQAQLPSYGQERVRIDDSGEREGDGDSLQLSTPFVTGKRGEVIEGQKQGEVPPAMGSPYGQEVGEGLSIESPAGLEAQITQKPEKPEAFSKVPTQGEGQTLKGGATSLYKGLKSTPAGVLQLVMSAAKSPSFPVPLLSMGEEAEKIFGPNQFSQYTKEISKQGEDYVSSLVKESQLTEEEARHPVNQMLHGFGKLAGDVLLATATAGAAEAPLAARTGVGAVEALTQTPIWKSIAEKALHGVKFFAPPSIVNANTTIEEAKRNGKSDSEALAEGMKDMIESEAGAAIPMQVSSGLKTVLGRAASRYLQSTTLAAIQQDLVTTVGNMMGEEKRPTFFDSMISGDFEEAGRQAAQFAPMGLLGVAGERERFKPGIGIDRPDRQQIADSLEKLRNTGLPAVAAEVEGSVVEKAKKPYKTEEQIYSHAEGRISELEKKREEGEELTEGEQSELSFLEGVPDAKELADAYGFGMRKPRYSEESYIRFRIEQAQDKLDALKDTPKNNKQRDRLQSTINKLESDIKEGRTLEAQMVEEVPSKEKPAEAGAEAEPTKPSETEKQKAGGVPFEQGISFEREAEGEAEKGAALREGEGKEGEVAPKEGEVVPKEAVSEKPLEERVKEMKDFSEANSPEEVDALLKNFKQVGDDAVLYGTWTQSLANKKLSEARKDANARKSELKKAVTKVEKKPKVTEKPKEEVKEGEEKPAKSVEQKKEKPPKGKQIIAAAYRPNEGPNKGKVFTGPNHKAAMRAAGVPYREIARNFATDSSREGPEFGFQTDKDAFISRKAGVDVARKSGQLDEEGHAQDVADGLSLHSHRVKGLDDREEPLQKFPGPGAMGIGEAESQRHNDDVARAADIHNKLGAQTDKPVSFQTWRDQFMKGVKSKRRYTENYLNALYDESEAAATYSRLYGKTGAEAIEDRDVWDRKTTGEIEAMSKRRSKVDIELTNDSIDRDLESMGLDPVFKPEATRFKDIWPRAIKMIKADKDLPQRLINELSRKIRGLEPIESAVLAYERARSRSVALEKEAALASASDPIRAKQLAREYDEALKRFQDISNLESRSNSLLGLSLSYLRTKMKSDFSYNRIVQRWSAARKRNGVITELTDDEKKQAFTLSNAIEKAEADFTEILQKRKIESARESLFQYLEFQAEIENEFEGGKKLTINQQIEKYSRMIMGGKNDPLELGLGVRGLVRALSNKLKTKDTNVLTDKIHNRLVEIMGEDWSKDQTYAALDGTGGFHQLTKQGADTQLRMAISDTQSFNKELRRVNSIKNPAEREKAMSKLIADRKLEVHDMDSILEQHIEDMTNEIDKIIEELNYELRSCE